MKEQIYTRPLVPLYLHEFTEAILDVIPSGRDMLPIHHGKVSLICDPYDIKGAFPTERMGDFAFEGSLDLLLVSGPPERKLIAAFDLPRGSNPRFEREKRLFFDHLGMFYSCIEKTQWRASLPKLITQFAAFPTEGEDHISIINPAQWDVMSRLAGKAENLGLHLLHEVALDAVIAISMGSDELPEVLTPLDLNKDYLRKTSFDAVITTRPPNCKPVCAIEFDGRVHDEPGKRMKDEKKNQACRQARLPLIRIPSVDVKAAQLGRRVIDVREQVQMKRAEASWLVVEELLNALDRKHFTSSWYLSQLHHFLCLEADAIFDLDPDSSATLRDYAGELWKLAEGRIGQLEAKITQIVDETTDKNSWDQWLAQYHRTEHDEAQEEVMRIGDRVLEFRRRIQGDYPSVIIDGWSGIQLLDMEFVKSPDNVRHGASRYSLTIQGNELLTSLGVVIKPRVIDLGPIGISVSADDLGVTSELIDKVAYHYLRRSAQDILEAYKTQVLRTIVADEHVIWQHLAADVWPRIPTRLVEWEIDRLLRNSVKDTETDFSKFTRENFDELWRGPRDARPTREVSLADRQQRLDKALAMCRTVLEKGAFTDDQKASLGGFVESLSEQILGELTKADR